MLVGNLAISKLLALKIFGPFLQSTYYWMSRSTFLGGGDIGNIILAGTPFFLERGVMAPFFRGPAHPHFEEKRVSHQTLKSSRQILQCSKYRPKYQPTSTSIWYINADTGQAASIKTVYNSTPYKNSPRGNLAKKIHRIPCITGLDNFFWLNYCRKSFVLPKPPRCIYVRVMYVILPK